MSLTSQPEADMHPHTSTLVLATLSSAAFRIIPAAHVIVIPSPPEPLAAEWPFVDASSSPVGLLRAAVLGLLLLAAKPATAASAQVLGYTVGDSTYSEVRASLQARGASPRDKGTSGHSGGPMLEASGRPLGIEGLRGAFLIFDAENRLAGGLLTLHKSRYEAVVEALKEKYTLVHEVRPFVGNRYAEFRAEGALISVDAPHLSFEMTVMYRTSAVKASMDREAEARAANRRRVEREQL